MEGNMDICNLAHIYHSCQYPSEIDWLWKEAKAINPKVIVEIGIYNGGTLKILSTLVEDPTGVVVGLDYDWIHWKACGGWDLNSGKCPTVLLDGDSHSEEALEKLKAILKGREIDVLFIDGDHSYDGCKKDHEMYGQLVRKGGMIVFHDLIMKRLPWEHDFVKKCGEYWDDLPQPKYCRVYAPLKDGIFGIGYIIKE